MNPFIIIGAGGLLTGLGGKYFFVLPVIDNQSVLSVDPNYGNWGKDAFNWNVPGALLQSEWNFDAWWRSAVTIMFGLQMGTLCGALMQNPEYALQSTLANESLFAQMKGFNPGSLGTRSGFIFLAILLFGVYKKIAA